jgi:iron only hydrogenase large subunit-like protein
MDHLSETKKLLDSSQKTVCMLAPSFVSEYEYPQIVYRLRALGFTEVVELTFGAKMTNLTYYSILKEEIDRTWISSPCPTIVNLIRTKYPHLLRNLVPVHSPMGCMSLICKKFYPDYKQVFVGPCLTKKLEAQELGGIASAITFKELEQLFEEYKVAEEITDRKYMETFDKFYNDYTKIYPISGGLSSTLHHKNILKKKDILVTEKLSEVTKIFDDFVDGWYKDYKFLDLLTCDGGCINGPGMIGNYSLKKRRKRVLRYRDYAQRYEKDLGRSGTKIDAEGINFERKFTNE